MKFTSKTIMIDIIVIITAIAISTGFAFFRINVELKRQAAVAQENILKTFWELLKSKGSDFSAANGKLYAGNYLINNNFELPDKVKQLFGGTATIFLADTRVSTNVLKEDGSRAIDTKLTGPAFDAVIRQGQPYRGEADILGATYFTAYDPIKNSKGEVIGALYVGIKRADFFANYQRMQIAVLFMALAVAVAFSLLRWMMVRKTIDPLIENLSNMSERIHSHSGSIAMTIDQQAGFATQLSSSVVEISSTMEEFTSTASQIAQHSQAVVERADKTLEDTKHGASEVENLTFKIIDISATIQSNLDEIVELGRKSKEINKIMEIINNIANQTKLIAFNAALEAASAGEAGKRFGVVAVEIRRLADSVVESTAEIEGRITEILDSVNRLVMSSEKSAQLIQEGQDYASHTVSMLIESVDGVDETTSAARQISLSTQQQQIASSQVVVALRDIEQGVRFSSDAVHKANVVTGELAALADQLRNMIIAFKAGGTVEVQELAPCEEQ